jgi:hypothetical protein
MNERGEASRSKSSWQYLRAVCSHWEKTKPKGRCQCDANEGHTQNYRYHGRAPLLVMLLLPEQGKEIRDRHHVLEFFGWRAAISTIYLPRDLLQ